MTSGGDSAGMNAAVRSVVKMAIYRGCQAYVIREGWEGLVRGNEEDAGAAAAADHEEETPTGVDTAFAGEKNHSGTAPKGRARFVSLFSKSSSKTGR